MRPVQHSQPCYPTVAYAMVVGLPYAVLTAWSMKIAQPLPQHALSVLSGCPSPQIVREENTRSGSGLGEGCSYIYNLNKRLFTHSSGLCVSV